MSEEKHHKEMKSIRSLDPESLIELLKIAADLQRIFATGKEANKHDVEKNIPLLMTLFQYLADNMDNPNIDKSLLNFLAQLLGLSFKKHKEEKELELEEEEEQELDKEEKERRLRLAMYELYKIINPHRLAGETDLDNFINNVRTRGIKEALKYEGSEYATKFDKDALENLESHRFSFVKALKDHGVKGGGLGM